VEKPRPSAWVGIGIPAILASPRTPRYTVLSNHSDPARTPP
jgi:hypothetical protein